MSALVQPTLQGRNRGLNYLMSSSSSVVLDFPVLVSHVLNLRYDFSYVVLGTFFFFPG